MPRTVLALFICVADIALAVYGVAAGKPFGAAIAAFGAGIALMIFADELD